MVGSQFENFCLIKLFCNFVFNMDFSFPWKIFEHHFKQEFYSCLRLYFNLLIRFMFKTMFSNEKMSSLGEVPSVHNKWTIVLCFSSCLLINYQVKIFIMISLKISWDRNHFSKTLHVTRVFKLRFYHEFKQFWSKHQLLWLIIQSW